MSKLGHRCVCLLLVVLSTNLIEIECRIGDYDSSKVRKRLPGRNSIDSDSLLTATQHDTFVRAATKMVRGMEERDYDPENIIFTTPTGITVTLEDMQDFEEEYNVKKDVQLSLQFVPDAPLESSSVEVGGTVFSLAGLEPLNVFAKTVTTHWVDGVEQPLPPPMVFTKKTPEGHEFTVTMTNADYESAADISSIVVVFADTGIGAEIVQIKDGVFVTVMTTDIDYKALNAEFTYGESEDFGKTGTDIVTEMKTAFLDAQKGSTSQESSLEDGVSIFDMKDFVDPELEIEDNVEMKLASEASDTANDYKGSGTINALTAAYDNHEMVGNLIQESAVEEMGNSLSSSTASYEEPLPIIFTGPDGVTVTQDEMDVFKKEHDVETTEQLYLQVFPAVPLQEASITVEGVVYELANLKPAEVVATGKTTYWVDGEEKPLPPPMVFTMETNNGVHFVIKMNKDDYSTAKDIGCIVVNFPSANKSAEIVPIKEGVYATIMSTDLNYEAIDKRTNYGDNPFGFIEDEADIAMTLKYSQAMQTYP